MKTWSEARRAARKLDGSHDHWLTLVSSGRHLLLGTVTVVPRRGRLLVEGESGILRFGSMLLDAN
jgi:hypothetical protein